MHSGTPDGPRTDEATSPRRAPWRRRAAFPTVALTLGIFLAAASAPSPLYAVYAERWDFSPVTLTAVFAVYAIALLAALLTTGTLSDSIGRRPVVLGSIGLLAASMVLFALADDVLWLYAARAVQGLATGVATAALAAWLLDASPADRPGLGPLVNGVAPLVALAAGALLAGALVQYGPAPLQLVYLLLLAALLLAAAVVAVLDDPLSQRRPVSLRPRLALPVPLRGPFLAVLPCIVATWALGGLYLSLGPSIVLSLTGTDDRLVGGVAVAALTASGAAAQLLLRGLTPRTAMVVGSWTLVVGVGVSLAGVQLGGAAVFLVGTAVAGIGFGLGFLGAFRILAALADPTTRGGLVSTVYVASYLAFSIPAVVAGVLTTQVGLRTTAVGYGVTVAALALLAVGLTSRQRVAASV